ncbi:MAG TPA: flagellar basal body L-ring protein FlgH [Candidatus Binatia bacterium]|nr:flagellar basal body L-ring protein FlgH [Candidatus Binatia bacterium]
MRAEHTQPRREAGVLLVILVLWGAPGAAAFPKILHRKPAVDPSQQALSDYLDRERQQGAAMPATRGSLWAPLGRFATLASDVTARRVGDVIGIQLVESTTSQQQGSLQTQRTFSASSGISAFFGTPGPTSGIQNLFSPASSQTLNGKGQTALSTTLQSTLAGTVVEVLPNGQLVVQAVREMEVSNEKQTMVLRGVVRPEDLSIGNTVLSTQVALLEVHLKGAGAMSDGTRPPTRLMRFLLHIFGF